jgi:hypothetical protein
MTYRGVTWSWDRATPLESQALLSDHDSRFHNSLGCYQIWSHLVPPYSFGVQRGYACTQSYKVIARFRMWVSCKRGASPGWFAFCDQGTKLVQIMENGSGRILKLPWVPSMLMHTQILQRLSWSVPWLWAALKGRLEASGQVQAMAEIPDFSKGWMEDL